MKKYILIVIVLVIALSFYLFGLGPIKEIIAPTLPESCIEEAAQCPDGSLVRRSGPSCDFEACPTVTINPTAKSDVSVTSKPVACTQEAKLCPDGSYVGRTGPKCEFAPCPSSPVKKDCPQLAPVGPNFCPNGSTVDGGKDTNGCQLPPKCEEAWQTYRDENYGFEIKYPIFYEVKEKLDPESFNPLRFGLKYDAGYKYEGDLFVYIERWSAGFTPRTPAEVIKDQEESEKINGDNPIVRKDVVVDGVSAKMLVVTKTLVEGLVVFEKNDKTYIFRYVGPKNDNFERFYKSFKFAY